MNRATHESMTTTEGRNCALLRQVLDVEEGISEDFHPSTIRIVSKIFDNKPVSTSLSKIISKKLSIMNVKKNNKDHLNKESVFAATKLALKEVKRLQ